MNTKHGQLQKLKLYKHGDNPLQVYRYDYQIDGVVFVESGEVLDTSEVIEHLNALNAYCEALEHDLDSKETLLGRIQTISSLIEEHYDR